MLSSSLVRTASAVHRECAFAFQQPFCTMFHTELSIAFSPGGWEDEGGDGRAA
jgi:hypothetical protein